MKTLYRRLLAAAISAGTALTMSTSVFAAAGMTEEQAVVIALEDAGFTKETVLWLRTEREDGCFEIEFTDAATGDEYEYEICISTGRIIEAEVEHAHEYGPDYD